MIDPFTLATGLAGLISLALELGKITREYQQAFQTTHDVVDDFISELKTLEDILKNLEHFLNASPARQISFSNSSCLCVTTGLCKKSLEHILTRLRSNRPKGRAISIVRRIRWPFDKQEIEQTIQNIRAYAHTFQFALTLDGCKILAHASDEVSTILRSQLQTLEAAKEVAKAVPTLLESTKEASQHLQGVLSLLVDSHARGDQIEGIATWIKELKVKDANETLERQRVDDAAVRGSLLDWISNMTFRKKQVDIYRSHHTSTGDWFLQSPTFQVWIGGPNSACLWCPGIPGAGKTVMTSLVIEHIFSSFQTPNVLLAYIYCDYKDYERQSAQAILFSILRQLVESLPEIPRDLQNMYKQQNTQQTGREKEAEPFKIEQCVEEIEKICRSSANSFIIIDALDECPERDSRNIEIRSVLFSAIKRLSAVSKILLTGRLHIEISSDTYNLTRLEIFARDSDIREYITSRIDSNLRLRKLVDSEESLREKILDAVTSRAAGMFLLARLQMDRLANQISRRNVRKALTTLPTGLNECFDIAVDRIQSQSEEYSELGNQAMKWICYTKRPLKISELREALAIQPDDKEFDESGCPEPELITLACCGLVAEDKVSGIVRFVHPTVQSYLEQRWEAQSLIYHRHIGQTCLTYLTLDAFDDVYIQRKVVGKSLDERYFKFQLLRYAACYCFEHIRGENEAFLNKKIHEFFCNTSQVENLLQTYYDVTYGSRNRQNLVCYPGQATPLHAASIFGLKYTLEAFLLETSEIDARDTMDRTPLIYSCLRGDLESVCSLLDQGADLNNMGHRVGSPLLAAADCNHLELARFLLERGAEVNALGPYNDTAIRQACLNGNLEMAKLLVAHGASIHPFPTPFGSPLEAAASHGHVETVAYLCKIGADTNEGDPPPLVMAAWGDQKTTTQVLLNYGADVNYLGHGHLGTALIAACSRGNTEIVSMLLDRGADVHIVHNYGAGNALEAAAAQGSLPIVKLLVERGADVNARGGRFETVLQAAVYSANEELVRYLLSSGADVNAFSRRRGAGTALICAVKRNRLPSLTAELLAAGADPVLGDRAGRNPFHYAVMNKNIKILEQLLSENGQSIVQNDELLTSSETQKEGCRTWPYSLTAGGITPLHLAIYGAWVEGVQLMMKHGADPAIRDIYGRTGFDWAVSKPSILCIKGRHSTSDSFTSGRGSAQETILYQSITRLIQMIQEDPWNIETSYFHLLGHCFLCLSEAELARICFECQSEPLLWQKRDNNSYAICSVCLERIPGPRFVCRSCPDTELCVSCMEEYGNSGKHGLCYEHNFLEVHNENRERLREGLVNEEGLLFDDWLQQLAKRFVQPPA